MSANNNNLDSSVGMLAQAIRDEINKASDSVDTKLGGRLNNIEKNIQNTDSQIDALRRDIGSIKNDVAVGNGQLRTFTIPKKAGLIRFRVNGEEIEARVDEKGNVTGKHVATSNIKPNQVEIVLDAPIEKDSTVSFVAGNLNDALKQINENLDALSGDLASVKSMQATQNETIVNIQKNFKESIDAVKKKVDDGLANYKAEFEKMNANYTQVTTKVERVNKKLIGIGNIAKEEGLTN